MHYGKSHGKTEILFYSMNDITRSQFLP